MENMPAPAKEFQDWEVLPSNFEDSSPPHELIHGIHYGGFIQPDYFSVEAQNRSHFEDFGGGMSAEPDNSGWIDSGSDCNSNRFINGESGEFLSDSDSDLSDDLKIGDFVGNNQNTVIGEIIDVEMENTEDFINFSSDSTGFVENSDLGMEINTNLPNEVEAVGEEKPQNESIGNSGDEVNGNGNKRSGEFGKRGVVWWKMPMEFLKCCVFRLRPVWTVSAAAAVMGILILSRRLYTMRRKSKGLEMVVTFDDKHKVSQTMSRAARLNEAFSVVQRVPVIRPSLPAVGVTSWPAMSLR